MNIKNMKLLLRGVFQSEIWFEEIEKLEKKKDVVRFLKTNTNLPIKFKKHILPTINELNIQLLESRINKPKQNYSL